MKSTLVSASILAIAALASANSFAEGRDPYPLDQLDQVSAASTKTRADVQAELREAQREGYSVNIGNTYQDPAFSGTPASTRTRAEVKAEASSGTAVSVSALEHAYPAVQ
jgi:hypothetical protein